MIESQDRRTKIDDNTQRWLWGASAGVCEYWWDADNCHTRLMQTTPGGQLTFVGQMAHVVPIGGSGPRSGSAPLGGDLDAPENLLLLCYIHHRFIDTDPATFTVEALSAMKLRWENSVDPLRYLAGISETTKQDYDRVRDFVSSGFKLAHQDWENFIFNVSGGRGRPLWLTDARMEARKTSIEVEGRWVRPSTVEIFKGHDDTEFEATVVQLSEAIREIDYIFGEGVTQQKPYGWEEYDWTMPDPSDWPEMGPMNVTDYLAWLGRLTNAVAQAGTARTKLVAEVVRREHTLLNNWP